MSGGEPGLHGIQGIGDGSKFLVDLGLVDEVRTIKTECAKLFAKKLAAEFGLFVGVLVQQLMLKYVLSGYEIMTVITV